MTPVIEVRGLGFSYSPGRPLLDGIGFTVEQGESVGILGANGAGKSTLLWCLLGLHRARGTVRLFGERPAGAVMRRLGVVFQNPEDLLFMPRLLDDLTLPLLNRGAGRAEALEAARGALARMGLEGLEDLPAGHLSLGQRKRAAIAAALAVRPELLVLDEPTAELDGRSVRLLGEYLAGLPVTLLASSHDLGFVERVCRRLIVLREGAILADGPAQAILGDRALLDQARLI